MDAAAELGKNPVSKHQIQPEYGDEQDDAGRDCQTRLARPNYQARTNADREIFLFPVQLTTCRTGNLPGCSILLLYVRPYRHTRYNCTTNELDVQNEWEENSTISNSLQHATSFFSCYKNYRLYISDQKSLL